VAGPIGSFANGCPTTAFCPRHHRPTLAPSANPESTTKRGHRPAGRALIQLLINAITATHQASNGHHLVYYRGHRVRASWPNVLLSLNDSSDSQIPNPRETSPHPRLRSRPPWRAADDEASVPAVAGVRQAGPSKGAFIRVRRRPWGRRAAELRQRRGRRDGL